MYLGHSPTNAGSFIFLDDIASGFNGSETQFTLQVGGVNITPNTQNLLIALDGIIQQAPDAYTVSGSTITFTGAVPSGTDFYGILMGQSASIGQGTIGADELKISGDGTSGQLVKSDGDGTYSYVNQSAVTADANVLSGTTLKSTVVNSSLTSVGTLTTLTVDNITLNSSDINNSTGNFTFSHGGSEKLRITSDKVMFSADAKVDANNTRDLGASGARWKDLYLAGNANVGGSATFADNVVINKASNPTYLQIGSSLADDPYMVFQSDGNTFAMGIDRSDSNKFKISDNATLGTNDRLVIESNGNTTLEGTTTTFPVGGILRFGERGNLTHHSTSYDMTFNTNSTANAMVIKGTGNVAIGGTGGYQKLSVESGNIYLTGGYAITWANGNATISESSYSLLFNTYDGSSVSNALTLAGNNNASFSGNITVDTGGTSVITADGNNNSGDDGRLVLQGHTSAYSRAYIKFNNGVTSGGQDWYLGALRGSNAFALSTVDDSNGGTNVFTVDGNKKIGIGTDPNNSYKVKVSGNIYADASSQFANALIGEVTISSTNYSMIGSNSSSRGIALCRDGSASYVGIVIEGDGYIRAPYVYIGNTSASANVVVTSDGFLYRSTSAKKYKTNIKNYNIGLDMINQMQPISYRSNKKTTRDKDNKTHAGLLADDIHDLGLTEFVEYNDDGEVENLHYDRLITVCINAIKELSKKVTALEGS